MKGLFSGLVFLWLVAFILLASIYFLLHKYDKAIVPQTLKVPNTTDSTSVPRKRSLKPEKIEIDTIKDDIKNCRGVSQKFESGGWFSSGYSVQYHICQEDYEFDKNHRMQLNPSTFSYGSLFTSKTASAINLLKDKFLVLKKDENLNELDLIKTIVESVQNIPYTLVHNGKHDDVRHSYLVNYHDMLRFRMPGGNWNQVGGCVENAEPFGVLGPLEVAYHHMADCDSRTLFLFSVLKSIGYDVVILNSDVEMHSILGVNLQNLKSLFGSAQFKDSSSGKTYTVWETTTNVDPGVYRNFRQKNWYIASY